MEISIVETKTFASLGLSSSLVSSIEKSGFQHPSPIQEMAIPLVLEGRDLIAQAQTGSGKTAAFVLPAIQKLKLNGKNEVLVLVPTRELADQVVKEVERFGRALGVGCVSVIGGKSISQQADALNRGAHFVVATPGRLLDHLRSGRLRRFEPSMVVLDEADEILDMGFIDDIKQILSLVPKTRQTLLFSATMPKPIADLAQRELSNPAHVCLVEKDQAGQHQHIVQELYLVREGEREKALLRLIQSESPTKAIIFCRTKKDADLLSFKLSDQGLATKALHGDLSQPERQKVIQDIKRGQLKILIATDIASRGIDIADMTHVFNFHLPESPERYMHRIGRTGRAGKSGKALTLVTEAEWRKNPLFRAQPSRSMVFKTLPTRGAVEDVLKAQFVRHIQEATITPSAETLCKELFTHPGESFDFLCRMVSLYRPEAKLPGPDNLGFSTQDWERLQQSGPHRRSHSGSSPSRPHRSSNGYRGGSGSQTREPYRGGGNRGGSHSAGRDFQEYPRGGRPAHAPRSSNEGHRSAAAPRSAKPATSVWG